VPPASRIAGGALAAYGALGLPLASAALPVYVHLPNLYGGLLGMNLALLGSLLLAARLLDALVDPLIGVLNDRLQRPRLLVGIGALLLAIGMLLVLNPPQASTSLGAWLMLALIPVYLGFSLASVSYHAWGALLGDDSHERTRVTASREAFGLAGVVAASVLPGWRASPGCSPRSPRSPPGLRWRARRVRRSCSNRRTASLDSGSAQ
jgi:GPH family glycoside/pentoside/hexuronide:cation symporter